MSAPIHFFECTPSDLRAAVESVGLPGYVAKQLLEWVYRHGVTDLEAMTNLSGDTRDRIRGIMQFHRGVEVVAQRATDGTRKSLIEWDHPAGGLPLFDDPAARDRRTETVMIPPTVEGRHASRRRWDVRWDAVSVRRGWEVLDRNLTAGQIVEQVHHLQAQPGADRITNIVFMGMGEPLANASAVFDAVRILNAPWAYGIGARRITISTVGLPAAIRKLDALEVPVTLALSLHAPNDALRRELIPWAEYSTVEELLDACSEWFDRTGREITLEYILLGGVNDRPEHARELVDIAGTMRANVNLIRYNEVEGLPFRRPMDADVRSFQNVLRQGGVNTHIRASRGRDIAAACGQLRHESADGQAGPSC